MPKYLDRFLLVWRKVTAYKFIQMDTEYLQNYKIMIIHTVYLLNIDIISYII